MVYILILVGLFISACSPQTTFNKIPDSAIITESTSYIKLNPNKNAPLSATLNIKAPDNALTITVKGQDGESSDIGYTWEAPTQNEFLITGLYFDYTNTVEITSGEITKTLKVVITNKAPEVIKSIEVLTNNRPITSERNDFLNFFNPVGALTDLFATDNFGKIRWYLISEDELHGMKFTNINNEVVFSILNTVKPEILTYNMAGKLIKKIKGPDSHTYNVPEADKRFHHDMYTLKNGNIIVLDKSQYGVEDIILELTPEGKIVKEIRIGDWIRKSVNNDSNDNTGLENFIFDSKDNPYDEYSASERYPGMPVHQNAIDWAHINALSFDENTGMIYLSFRQHGIFAFDYNNESLEWIYIRDGYTIPNANLPFYNFPTDKPLTYVYQIPALQPYILKGPQGPDHPHAITVLSNNTFMVFDNSGNDGEFPQEGSRLMVFSVDPQNMTAKIDWEYRHANNDGSLVYSQIVSDIDKTPFDTYIGAFGAATPFTYVEVDQNKQVLFDMRLDLRHQGPADSDIAMPIACPTSRLMQNGIFLYRADYASIYPNTLYSID